MYQLPKRKRSKGSKRWKREEYLI